MDPPSPVPGVSKTSSSHLRLHPIPPPPSCVIPVGSVYVIGLAPPYAPWFRLIVRPVADLGDCPFGARAALTNGLMIRRA